jgi:hypothetical protein
VARQRVLAGMMDSMQTEMELVASRMRERDKRFRPSTTNVYMHSHHSHSASPFSIFILNQIVIICTLKSH